MSGSTPLFRGEASPNLSKGEEPHSPRFSESIILMMLFASGEQRYDIDVVVISFGLAMQHRSFALIKGLKEM